MQNMEVDIDNSCSYNHHHHNYHHHHHHQRQHQNHRHHHHHNYKGIKRVYLGRNRLSYINVWSMMYNVHTIVTNIETEVKYSFDLEFLWNQSKTKFALWLNYPLDQATCIEDMWTYITEQGLSPWYKTNSNFQASQHSMYQNVDNRQRKTFQNFFFQLIPPQWGPHAIYQITEVNKACTG